MSCKKSQVWSLWLLTKRNKAKNLHFSFFVAFQVKLFRECTLSEGLANQSKSASHLCRDREEWEKKVKDLFWEENQRSHCWVHGSKKNLLWKWKWKWFLQGNRGRKEVCRAKEQACGNLLLVFLWYGKPTRTTCDPSSTRYLVLSLVRRISPSPFSLHLHRKSPYPSNRYISGEFLASIVLLAEANPIA